MADVFMCYHRSKETSALVRRIADELESIGISCWYDTKNPSPGRFADIIEKEIGNCKIFLFFWDIGANQSDWCYDEVFAALAHKKLLIPLQLGQFQKRSGLLLRLRNLNIFYGGDSPEIAQTEELITKIAHELGVIQPEKPKFVTMGERLEAERKAREEAERREAERKAEEEAQRREAKRKANEEAERRKVERKAQNGARQRWEAELKAPSGAWQRWVIAAHNLVEAETEAEKEAKRKAQEEAKRLEAERKAKAERKAAIWKAFLLIMACLLLFAGYSFYHNPWVRETISAGDYHTLGLRKDGTVIAVGLNYDGQCNVTEWRDIVSVSAGGSLYDSSNTPFASHTVGLCKDGTVVAVGANGFGQCDVSEWRNIVAVSAGKGHTVGLRKDGTVVAVGDNHFGQCDVSEWQDIAAVSAGSSHTVGLRKDGTVVAVGSNKRGQCNVLDWTDIRLP